MSKHFSCIEKSISIFCIYKFESQNAYEAYETSPELAAALEETRETWKEKGYERKWRVQYEVMKTWKR